jgi:hypothetical protein
MGQRANGPDPAGVMTPPMAGLLRDDSERVEVGMLRATTVGGRRSAA